MQYRFGHHTLDVATVQLRCGDRPVDLEPRSFAVLRHLVEHHDRVVPKHELLDEVWGDRFVSESALTTRIKQCRRALGDDGSAQRFIKTVHRVGYRFVAEVATVAPGSSSHTPGPILGVSPRWASGALGALVGRQRELDAVDRRLATSAVVTVTGPGGVGKSRLAAAVADQAAVTGCSVWWCDLTTTRDPSAVAEVVLASLGERTQIDADPLRTLARITAARDGLVLLDNCEHLLDAVRDVVSELTRTAGALRVLATSRIPLDASGESVLVLEPLSIDAAVQCFVERATASGAPVIDPTDPALAQLCDQLDRMPLAIELAAARARLLAPRDMLQLLDDRFRLLRRATTSDHDPHGSLEATIEWSWSLLEPRDRRLLAELSVFVGSFSLDDAAGVTTPEGDVLDVVDGLDRLLRASMLVAVPAGEGRRFRLLESIRDFAAHRLDSEDRDTLRRRHAEHYARSVERLDAQLRTDHVDAALSEMGRAWANVRAAVEHAIATGDMSIARRVVRAVGVYADLYQAYEVIDWCDRALATSDGVLAADDDPQLLADAVAIWARLLAHRGDHDRAAELAATAHAAHVSFATQLSVVWTAYYRGDLAEVVAGAARLVDLSKSDRGVDRAYADGFDAIVAAVRGEPVLQSTEVTAEEAQGGVLGALRCLTEGFRLSAADPATAAGLLEAVVDVSLKQDYRLLLGAAASTLTQMTLPERPHREAMRTLCRTLDRYLDRGMWQLISADTVMAASLLADAGDDEVACRLLGARNASGYRVGMSEAVRARLEERLRASLGPRFDAVAAEGAAWNPPRAGAAAVSAMRRHLDQR